ncbi:hypothetical protein AVEN_130505-1 [Araneus ventricosus]|uniref:Uncharacterized protein n=1 Tax=Araneus ventricosus TaxID=182803 RepID=A0A4Y2EJ30_ARAVE|nr:hypothetical protein AVEN_130505-1 [Araneus ventricosus]
MEFLEHGKEKHIVKVKNLSNLEQMIRNGGIEKNLKSKTQSADSNLRPRCEGRSKTKDLLTLAPRVEVRNETRNPQRGRRATWWQEFCNFELCLKTNFGTSVNALPNFFTKMGGEKNSLRANGIASLVVNVPALGTEYLKRTFICWRFLTLLRDEECYKEKKKTTTSYHKIPLISVF